MNILSISGGGCRGVLCLYLLREIEEKYNKPIAHLFDYFSGSSVGSIIISALLISDDGINPKHTCKDLYGMIETLCKKIFSNTFYHRIKSGYGWIGSKYSTDNLELLLNDFFGNVQLKQLLKPICFPSFDGISQKPIYFTQDKHGDLYLKDILRCTTAAPTYFDGKNIDIEGIQFNCGELTPGNQKYLLYDSGVVCNNTAMIAELHATRDMVIIDKTKIFELCLGTGYSVIQQPSNYGMLGWVGSIVDYLLAGSNENEMYQLHLVLNKENIKYVNFEINNKYDQLDNASDDAIKYYTSVIKQWIDDNHDTFFEFMDRLIANHDN